jgi:hypothetical protein
LTEEITVKNRLQEEKKKLLNELKKNQDKFDAEIARFKSKFKNSKLQEVESQRLLIQSQVTFHWRSPYRSGKNDILGIHFGGKTRPEKVCKT